MVLDREELIQAVRSQSKSHTEYRCAYEGDTEVTRAEEKKRVRDNSDKTCRHANPYPVEPQLPTLGDN
jgi:hypothetical protein